MKKITTLLVAAVATAFIAGAVPARRGFITYTQPDGSTVMLEQRGDEFSHYYVDAAGNRMIVGDDGFFTPVTDAKLQSLRAANKKLASLAARSIATEPQTVAASRGSIPQSGLGLFTTNYPRKGEVHSLVFLVEYADVKFTIDNPADFYKRQLNEQGFKDYGATGSARDYFLYQSREQFQPTFDVFGPVTLKYQRAYYGGNDTYGDDRNPEKMALEAAAAYAGEIDFSKYDYDGDGCIDNIYVIYAGVGEADSNLKESVWPHSWEVSNGPTYNGKKLFSYTCSNEWDYYANRPDGIGTFVHEFSHVLGLPDLYHTSSNSAYYTPCDWSVMDYGPYNNDGLTPPNYSAYERNALQWIEPKVLTGASSVSLEAIDKSNECYLIPTEKTNEFFLLENRQQNNWDKYIPYHGMLVWHIDFNQTVWDNNVVNNTKNHQYVDIVEANNDPNGASQTALRGYPFPGSKNVTSLTSTTTPALKSWAGKAIDLPLTSIKETSGVISFDVAGGIFDLPAPAAPTLTAAENGTITATWKAVDKAQSYRLNVWHYAGTTAVADYTDYEVTGTTATLNGFEGITEYSVTVTACAGSIVSEASAVATVTTPEVGLQYIKPVITKAQYYTDTETLCLEWIPVKGDVSYTVVLEERTGTGTNIENVTVDFGSSSTAITLPEGWTTVFANSKKNYYDSNEYTGQAIPSLKLFNTGDALISPVFDSAIAGVSFWVRGASASGTSALHIYGRLSATDEWTEVYAVDPLATYTAAAATLTFVPQAEINQIKFEYDKSGGNCALDDIVLTFRTASYGQHSTVDAGTASSISIPFDVRPAALRATLYATHNQSNATSMTSEPVIIETDGAGGIDSAIEVDANAPVVWYNLQGMRIAEPTAAGVYLRRQGTRTSKVVLR